MSNITVRSLLRLWLLQAALLLLVAIGFWWFNHVTSYSILAGGLILLIPNIYFALYAFRFRGAQASHQVLLGFYRGEVGKFILSCAGFSSVFVLVKPLNVLALFISYILLMIVQWIFLGKSK